MNRYLATVSALSLFAAVGGTASAATFDVETESAAFTATALVQEAEEGSGEAMEEDAMEDESMEEGSMEDESMEEDAMEDESMEEGSMEESDDEEMEDEEPTR